jgi:DNA modification methylase
MPSNVVTKTRSIDWDFPDSGTSNFTHAYHPYPAKFIPHIPRHLIEIFSEPGDKVLDPFCGSGTTLVEAILHDRDTVGIDINPLSALIAKVKSTPMKPETLEPINDFLFAINQRGESLQGQRTLFAPDQDRREYPVPEFPKLRFWFDDIVIKEAALIRYHIYQVSDQDLQDFLKVAFSSILVSVSKQDSDTRYTRREKNIQPGDTVRAFARRVSEMASSMRTFAQEAPSRRPIVLTADAQKAGELIESSSIDLVVTSPPYPNAYSYHLYHRNRMFWLDMDPYPVKRQEIGSHRKYSAKNGATVKTFKVEMANCFRGLQQVLKDKGYCCFVIGDSIVRGELVRNNEVLKEVANETGFEIVDDIRRTIQETRKAFNPKYGRIKQESILIFRNKKV